jgi:hypothetical protein
MLGKSNIFDVDVKTGKGKTVDCYMGYTAYMLAGKNLMLTFKKKLS